MGIISSGGSKTITLNGTKTVQLNQAVQERLTKPIITYTGRTSSSLDFRIVNPNTVDATIYWQLFNTVADEMESTGNNLVAAGEFLDLSFDNLPPSNGFRIQNVYAEAPNRLTSVFAGNILVSTAPVTPDPTVTTAPDLVFLSNTSSSVAFQIINEEPNFVTIEYSIRQGSVSGTVVKSDILYNIGPGVQTNVSASQLQSSTQYWIVARAIVPNEKTLSDAAILSGTTLSAPAQPTTSTPLTSFQDSTETTIRFVIENADLSTASISWNIRVGSQGGTVVASNTENNVASGASFFATASGLTASTTYYLTDVRAQAFNEQLSAAGVVRSGTTQAAAPPPPTCPSAGTFLRSECDPFGNEPFALYYVYANGTCGETYLLAEDPSTTCGYSPPSCPAYGPVSPAQYRCSGADRQQLYHDGNCNEIWVTIEANSSLCQTTPTTSTPTVNLFNASGQLGVFIQNNDSSTVSLSYSGSALDVVSGLPSSLSAGASFTNDYFVFGGATYQLCVTATASGKDPATACDSQSM